MDWSEDKARLSELGGGIITLCVALLALAVLSIAQTVLVWRVGQNHLAEYGDDLAGMVYYKTALTALNVVLFFVSAAALFVSNSKWAVILALGTLVFANFGSLMVLMHRVSVNYWSSLSIWELIGYAIFFSMIAFLLFSKDIERVYQFGSRRFFTHDLVNLWRKGRNRPSLEDSEADRLNNTFN